MIIYEIIIKMTTFQPDQLFDFEKRAPSKRGLMVGGSICQKMSQAAYRNPYDYQSLNYYFDFFLVFMHVSAAALE